MEKIKKFIITLIISVFSMTSDYIPTPKQPTIMKAETKYSDDNHMFI